ncbi:MULTISPECIES: DUF6884 domain-containing protein [unclassified Haloferax]|uniref:DUF6884 domain-containing protein n=1 Tax=unclassified Haloferax TaxID=2625095 RepID=UPI002875A077|nr:MULTISPECIES: DUF6884 domain-containing protein [unclassified Haloferax]MDS0243116.1 hypothetical protein [Haloferax sp. S2CR25]MDS0446237.1 hypothetical protein [Haloferax sp. S2CR25-2]
MSEPMYGGDGIETERDDGSTLVETSSSIRDDSHLVGPADRPLYELLVEILSDARVPDLVPARLATECRDLVDARNTALDIERGHCTVANVSYGLSYCYEIRDAIDDYRDRDPLTLVAVGCSGSKHDVDEPVPAADLYKHAYWSCKRDYGETVGDDWMIISAKHAVLAPDERIDYYECTPDHLEGIPVDSDLRLPSGDPVMTLLDQWALRVYNGLQTWLTATAGGVDPRDAELEILLGTKYRNPLGERGVFNALRAAGSLSISFPFQEVEQARGGNGNQMGWMTDEVEAATGTKA